MKVYRYDCSFLQVVTFSFVEQQGKKYWFMNDPPWNISLGTGTWDTTPAGALSYPSSWLEVLLLTGRSRAEIEQQIDLNKRESNEDKSI
jgi:hypothetical protein